MSDLTQDELDELRESFDYNDLDHDGMIQLDEFISMLDALEAGVSREEAVTGFREIDSNEDGLIDFDEFVAWWRQD
ncbi:MAG TPA: EF-hand domain-containing protein [Gammaproteobacteria bacterium]